MNLRNSVPEASETTGVLRFVDHTHTPASELFKDAVMRDGLANHRRKF
jgi:hypothetical protein